MYFDIITIIVAISFLYTSFITIRSVYNFLRLKRQGVISKGIQFRTYSGMEVSGKPLFNYNTDEYVDALKDVEIVYLESNPKIFIINGQKYDYKQALAMAILLLVFPFMAHGLVERNTDIWDSIKHLFDKF